jgi:hypothetical protein
MIGSGMAGYFFNPDKPSGDDWATLRFLNATIGAV